MDNAIFSKLAQLADKAQAADIITLVSTPPDTSSVTGKMLIVTDGNTAGLIIAPAFTKLVVDKITTTEWKKPTLFELEYCGGQYRLFWDKLSQRRSALVLGAGHVSQPLTELLAKLGYAVTVVDDRPDFANVARFPLAEQVVCQEFGRALAALPLSGFGVIIVVTRGHRYDMECLRAVISQPAKYIGMIGSQGRVRVVINELQAAGFDSNDLNRLRAPIGLDIGAETPLEIALSIAAEILTVERNAGSKPLSEERRCKHA